MSKYLFLDVDGVLNRDGTKERVDGFTGVDAKLLKLFLDWKVKRPDVYIVLSSTWRIHSAFTEALRKSLAAHGVEWVGTTIDLKGHEPRWREINFWLAEHPGWTHFAILDDIENFGMLSLNHVKTFEEFGLQDKHLIELDKLLGYAETPK